MPHIFIVMMTKATAAQRRVAVAAAAVIGTEVGRHYRIF
jgi:hypothetical protein